MKTHTTFKTMLTALILFTASLSITSVEAEAKAYKAKTIKVTSGTTKTVKTKKKIKKVTICSKNKKFEAYKVSNKKFKLYDTDYGKTQTVKIKYTNGRTQKYKIETILPSYAQKIVNELKPLLDDPDKGLQTSLADWKKQKESKAKAEDSTFKSCEIKLRICKGLSRTKIKEITVDDIMKDYTASQKKAFILELYFIQRMKYGKSCWYRFNRESNKRFKLLYQGKYEGVCEDGAAIAYDICKYLGIKAFGPANEDHAWCCVYATDKNGKSYWHGIDTTSYSYNLKASIPAKFDWIGSPAIIWDGSPDPSMTTAQLKKYLCSPNASTNFNAHLHYSWI